MGRWFFDVAHFIVVPASAHRMRTEEEIHEMYKRLDESKTQLVRSLDDEHRAQQERLVLGVLRWVLDDSDRFPFEVEREQQEG